MEKKNLSWHKLADHINEIDFAPNRLAVVELNGKKFCLARLEEAVFAFALKCPHAGALLSGGFIDAQGNIVCPLHRYRYDIKNGRNVSGEGYYLNHWPVEIRADGVYLGMETRGWNIFR